MDGNYQNQDSQGPSLLHRAYQTTLRVLAGGLTAILGAGPAGAATIPSGFGTEDRPMDYTIEGGVLDGNYGDMRACVDKADVIKSGTDTRTIDSIMIQGGEGSTQVTRSMQLVNPDDDVDEDFAHPAYCFNLTEEILRAGLTGDGNKGELTIHINQGDVRTYEQHKVHYTLETDDDVIIIDAPTGFGATLSGVTYDAESETYTLTLTRDEGRSDTYTLQIDAFDRAMGAVTISTSGIELSSEEIEHGTSSIDTSAYDLSDYETLRFKVCNDTTADCEMEKAETPNGGDIFAEGVGLPWYEEADTEGEAADFEEAGDEPVETLGHGATSEEDDSLEGAVEAEITATEWQSRMAQAIGAVDLSIRTRYKGTTGRVGRAQAETGSERQLEVYSGTRLDVEKYVAQLNHYAKATWGAPLIGNNTTVSMTFDAHETDSVQATDSGIVTTMNTGTHSAASIEQDKAYLHNNGRSPVARIMFNETLDVGEYHSHSSPSGSRTATTGNRDAAVQDYSFGLTFTTTIDGTEISVPTQTMDIGVYPVDGDTPEQIGLTVLAIGGAVGTAAGIIAAVDQTNKRKAAEAEAERLQDEIDDLLDNPPKGGNEYTPSHDTAPDEHTE